MTVADQPWTGKMGRAKPVAAPPAVAAGRAEQAILPPEPRVELRAGTARPRWLELFDKGPEMGAAEVKGAGDGRKPGADVVDWLIMETLEQKGKPVAAAPGVRAEGGASGGDLIDELVANHLERATGPVAGATAENGSEQGERHLEGMLQKEIDALLNGTAAKAAGGANASAGAVDEDKQLEEEIAAVTAATQEIAAEMAGIVPMPASAPPGENAAEAAASDGTTGLSQAELDVLVPGGTAGLDADSNKPAQTDPVVAPPPVASPQNAGAIVDEEMASKLNEAEGVLAEELAQLMAETHEAEKEAAPVAEKENAAGAVEPAKSVETAEASATVAAPATETAPIAPEQPAAVSENANAVASAAETTATAPEATANADTAAAAPAPAASPLPPGVPPVPVVILLPDEESFPEEEKVGAGKKIGRLVSDLGLMVAQIVDLPFGWMDAMNKNLMGLAAFLFLVSGAVLTGVAWWMSRH